jgi:WD40 repeat protein
MHPVSRLPGLAQTIEISKLKHCGNVGKLKTVISGHLGWVRSVAVEPGNQWFATGAGDRVIKVSLHAPSLG